MGTKKLTGRRVAIIGSAPSEAEVPWDDESLEIWVLAWREGYKRRTLAFDLHRVDSTRQHVPKNYLQYLTDIGCPVYLQTVHPHIPNSVRYPLDEVASFLAKPDRYADGYYFSSSISYMIALAMYEGVQEIHLYGVDLQADGEYEHQRPNTEYLIGLARGMGISVYVPTLSAMLKFPYRYGYDPEPIGPVTEDWVKTRVNSYKQQREDATADCYKHQGAVLELQEAVTKELFEQTPEIKERIDKHNAAMEHARTRVNTLDGAIQQLEELGSFLKCHMRGRQT